MSPEPGSWWCWNMLKRVETCWNMAGPRSYSWLFQPLAGPRPANRLERWRRRVVLSGGCTKLRQFSYVFIEKISWKIPKTYEFCCFFLISQILLCPTYGFPPRWMVAWVTAGSCLGSLAGQSWDRPGGGQRVWSNHWNCCESKDRRPENTGELGSRASVHWCEGAGSFWSCTITYICNYMIIWIICI